MKRTTIAPLCAGLAGLILFAVTRPPARPDHVLGDVVAKAIVDPARAGHRPADGRRKPSELIILSGMKPGDRVLDLIPGDGYFTRIFSKIVGPEGRVYAVWPEHYARYARTNVRTLRQLAASHDYPNVVTVVQQSPVLSAPEQLDVVWTSKNYPDYPDEFMGNINPSILNNAVFDILKPGGVFMVIDHSAAAGHGMADTEELHRIDPETVKAQVQAAGFVFEGETAVLKNPADPLNIPVFDKGIRGDTSQFAFKFRKPA